MTGDRIERRLAAILAADVAGYSRLMGMDEEGTHERLKSRYHDLVNPKIQEHHGRIVKNTGDGILAEFPSVVEAVRCAAEVQSGMADRNANTSDDQLITFRIGINLGDIIVEADDIYGDGVNIAARLEALADPGGICISHVVRDQIGDRLGYTFEDIGDQQLKNISRPIRAYRMSVPGGGQPISSTAALSTLALPGKPSVAVLPFTNMSGDVEDEFFSDGIADDIITALSRNASLFVIARSSSFTYRNCNVEVREIGRELGVRYVLGGSLRKSGNRIRISAQLAEAETGNHVWVDRYDRELADLFAVQDDITEAVTVAVAPAIDHAERRRAMTRPAQTLDAWSAYQRGSWHLARFTREDTKTAQYFFRRAIDLNPFFGGGYAGLALTFLDFGSIWGLQDMAEAQTAAEECIRRAVAADGDDGQVRSVFAITRYMRGDHASAISEAQTALESSPSLAQAHGVLGQALIFSGRLHEGIASLASCIRLDPRSPRLPVRLSHTAIAHYLGGEYQAAAAVAARATRSYPEYPI